ncbi:hypothetical protein [Halobacterium wangiae]|uniref:hypothetical protein n=1 Tax=Halobacterium wangiae TaxID=2902623 RepID=UPI001E2A8EB4|nr:hypothetical protein [Halobacterium wangiae]
MIRAVALSVLVVASLAVGPAAGASPVLDDAIDSSAVEQSRAADAQSTAAQLTTRTIEKSIRLHRTPGEPGEIDVSATYDVPDELTSMKVRLPAEAHDVRSKSFSPDGDRYAWDGNTDPATLRFSILANQSASGARSPAVAADGTYSFADTGEWALVTVPGLGTEWSWRNADSVTITEDVAVDGPGSTGGEIAYLGDVEEYTRTANGQTFTLVVPERATMAEPPGDVLDALAAASSRLRVGARDENVWFVAAPANDDWGVRGVEYGGNDAWVLADAALSDPGNVWLHEYVHTRQDYTTAASGRWTMEAAAEYYAASLSMRAGLVEFDSFQRYVGYGERSPWRDATLARPETWAAGANYLKGSLVWGSIDRRLRLETDSGATTDDVVWRLNDQDGPVTNADVLDAVAAVSSSSTREYAQRYTETSATPGMWSEREHAEAFDTQPARMRYDSLSYDVTGPFRDESVGAQPTVYVGETLTLSATVTNDGGTAGTYVVKLTFDDAPLAEARGELDPTQSDDVRLQHEFAEPGTYNLTVGRDTVQVTVRQPAEPVVENLSVSPAAVAPGADVSVTATFSNPTDDPATGTVPLTVDGQQVGSFDVTLGADESVTRSRTVTLDERGERELGVGDLTVRVTVGESEAPVPGFGVGVALAVLALTGVGALARRER